jgi:hypothetical protein
MMKRSLLKLLTSIYIMLVSVILIVISAYAWFTLSDAPETRAVPMEVAGRDAIGLPAKTYSIWDGTTVDPDDIIRDQNGAYVIYHAAEFATAMRLAEDPAIGDMTIRMEADISLADLNWRPVTVTAGAGSTKTVFSSPMRPWSDHVFPASSEIITPQYSVRWMPLKSSGAKRTPATMQSLFPFLKDAQSRLVHSTQEQATRMRSPRIR